VLAGAIGAPVLWFPESSVAKDTSEIGRVQLGRGELGLLVPEMGVGAWSWGDSAVWGYGAENGATSGSIEQAYRACLQSGVSLIDTAEVYGESNLSENILGKLIAGTPVQERSKVQVATKFYPVDPKVDSTSSFQLILAALYCIDACQLSFRAHLPVFHMKILLLAVFHMKMLFKQTNFPRSAADILPALDRSLKRLGLESVDLYQIHNPGFLSVLSSSPPLSYFSSLSPRRPSLYLRHII
jgi:aryl-alcohol dehydrogenase-like predicted oxidoreductase